MRVLIEGRSLANRAGTGTYVLKLIEEILRIDSDSEYFVLVPSEARFTVTARNLRVIRTPSHGIVNRLYGDLLVRKLTKKHNIQLIHYTKGFGPVIRKIPTIVTVHDLIPLTNPEFLSTKEKIGWRTSFPRSIRSANRIITVSHFSKDCIFQMFPEVKLRTTVIYNGFSETKSGSDDNAISVPGRYALFVGRVQERKNVARLLRAFDFVAREIPDLHLVICGEVPKPQQPQIRNLTKSCIHPGRIHMMGYVPSDKLPALYRNALYLVFPSLAEGFGIPVIESQYYGVPVLTSNTTSLPEIAGQAAVYVNPMSVQSIAEGMHALATNANLRKELISLGYKNIERFSWKETAEKTLSVYKSVYDQVK